MAGRNIALWVLAEKDRERKLAAARRDGAEQIPGQYDAQISQTERAIVMEYEESVRQCKAQYELRDAALRRDYDAAARDFHEAKDRYEKKKQELDGRPVHIELAWWHFALLAGIVFGAEFPINAAVFKSVFPEGDLFAYAAAALLVVPILFVAHFVGKSLRQRKQRVFATLGALVVIAVILGLAYLRHAVLTHPEDPDELSPAARAAGSYAVTAFFVAVNLLLFFTGVWIGAKRHDPDDSYEERYRDYLRTRKKAVKLLKLREQLLAEHQEMARGQIGLYQRVLLEYRAVNFENRELKATPRAWFDNPPEKLIREELAKIERTIDELVL